MRHHSLRVLFLSCFLGLTAGSGLLPLSSIQIAVQAAELNNQGSQDGVIKACTGQSVNLGAPQLTEADLKVLTGCSSGVIPQLLEALKSKDWKVRAIAAYTLGLFGKQAQGNVPALINLLKDKNADVRFVAAQALGKIDSEQAVSPLIAGFQDQDENVRFAAADALLQFGAKVKKDKLITFVRYLANENQTPIYPNFTIADYLKPESKLAIPAYVEALGNRNWFLRNRAASKLKELRLDSISTTRNTLWLGISPQDGYIRSVFTDVFLRTNLDNLIKILETSKDNYERGRVAQILGMLSSKKSISSLINTLQNERDLIAMQEIVKALGRIGAKEAIPVIVKAWQDANYSQPNETTYLRKDTINTLNQIGSQDALLALIKVFPKEKMSFISLDVVRKIIKGEITPEQSIKSLQDILQSGDVDAIKHIINPPELAGNNLAYVSVLNEAFQHLGLVKTTAILRPILLLEDKSLASAEVGRNRYIAVNYISSFGADAVPFIVKSFTEVEAFSIFSDVLRRDVEDASVQEFAKQVLSQVSVRIVPTLIVTMQDTKSLISTTRGANSNARIAVETLGQIRSRESVSFLIKSLLMSNLESAEASNLKFEAIIALGEIGSEEAVPALTITLKDKESYIRWWSAISLGRIGSVKAIPQLIEALQHDSEKEVRKQAAKALGKIASSNAVPILIASLNDKSYHVREAAAKSLGQIKSKEAIPNLIEALKDKAWIVRLEVSVALKSIGSESTPYLIKILHRNRDDSSILRTMLKDKNADQRRSAAYVLWQMGTLGSEAKDKLMTVVNDESDNLYVRWMAAMALERMGDDMEQFFQKHNLISPKALKPNKCPNDIYNAEINSRAYANDFYDEVRVDMNELVYAGRCIYGYSPRAGGTSYGFFERLLALLNRR